MVKATMKRKVEPLKGSAAKNESIKLLAKPGKVWDWIIIL